VSTSERSTYHHGDLRTALLGAAMELLEEEAGGGLSLRAVSRRAGVSAAAPYRHFADKDALESALAAAGFADLRARLSSVGTPPRTAEEFAALGVVYVGFALDRPALFRLMFGDPCDSSDDVRASAAAEVSQFLLACVGRAFPQADTEALATASWSLVHGLAFLHLDGKLPAAPRAEVDSRVRSAVTAILTLRSEG
jgi:AcrR family transcriptional regulator